MSFSGEPGWLAAVGAGLGLASWVVVGLKPRDKRFLTRSSSDL